jgi:hypothetical protein
MAVHKGETRLWLPSWNFSIRDFYSEALFFNDVNELLPAVYYG